TRSADTDADTDIDARTPDLVGWPPYRRSKQLLRPGGGRAGRALEPPAHLPAILSILLAEPSLEVALLPRNDAVTDQQQGRHEGDERPRRAEQQGETRGEQSLTDVVGVSAEAIGARNHQTA